MNLKDRVASRIKTIRKLRQLTQEQLAQRVDRTVFAISQLERGRSLPSFETLERLSVALEVPVKEFFDDGSETAGMSSHRLILTTAVADRVRSMADDQIEATLRMMDAMWPKAR
ncbi:MAG: helix-turn-helix transcriptional regulator [Sphingomonas sp.]|uniref:helix-turn-helix domain-containing protein n=1 Tax=Sphingomonas sp. TaxID=28214 RepID=UPI001AC25FBB|nr:helix-turn-helix transcriptional regulator [Sphingomonas sp.]MBN8816058.1 helix-turn-helix transcriptional regulator [Sphingomonas sp.]